jgi:hypothetical protein
MIGVASVIQRTLQTIVAQRLKSYSAVALGGPRPDEKTLMQKFSHNHYDWEKEQDRLRSVRHGLFVSWLLRNFCTNAPNSVGVFQSF